MCRGILRQRIGPDESDDAARNGTNIIVRDEVKIETVIIILWVAGGVLLMTLLILLVCILRNNKKSGAQCGNGSRVLRIDPRRANSRDGRLNHGYTNYDEIWTWIPIIRGNEGECPRTSVYTTPSSNDLQPPPYNEVVGSSAIQPTATTPSPHETAINLQNQVSSFSATNQIANDVIVNRALEENAQNSCISVRNEQTISVHNSDSMTGAACSNIVESELQTRQRLQSEGNHLNNGAERRRTETGNCNSRQHLARARDLTGNDTNNIPSVPDTPDHYRDVIYHPEQGLYSFLRREGGRRAWCDIPPNLLNEDGPPPYTPAPDYPGRHHNTRRTSFRQAVSEIPPRYSRRHQGLTDERPDIPPDYTSAIEQDFPNSRAGHVERNTTAPIVRCDYDYF
ncbi:uncharacterized protein LOC125672586 isoform X2 [Ostrea edulis]|uniref:uncharacterized protein LOC125672586 isoform X2 n=1 Tax=Ostrea edulis TaxID=37623 RepID=UPI0024B000AC|nr:uncharacterized protein LOC125672586 isoform X2 [Ostrea edulis]